MDVIGVAAEGPAAGDILSYFSRLPTIVATYWAIDHKPPALAGGIALS